MSRRARRRSGGARGVAIACSRDVLETLQTVAPTLPGKASIVAEDDKPLAVVSDTCDVLVLQSTDAEENLAQDGVGAGDAHGVVHPVAVLALMQKKPVVSLDWAMKSAEAGRWLVPSSVDEADAMDDNDDDAKGKRKATTGTKPDPVLAAIEETLVFDAATRERVARCDALKGLRIGVSGNLPSKDRVAVDLLVERAGGTYVADDQENVDVLIVEPDTKGKAKAAEAKAMAEKAQCVTLGVLVRWILAGKRPTAHLTPAKSSRRASRGSALTPSTTSKEPTKAAKTPRTASKETPLAFPKSARKESVSKTPAPKASVAAKASAASAAADTKSDAPQFVVAASGLEADERDVVVKAVAHVPGAIMVRDGDTFAESATHIVVPSLQAPSRTLKVTNGIARGAWILEASWVYASIEAGAWVPEEPHEAVKSFPGCQKTRLLAKESENALSGALLRGVKVGIDGAKEPPAPVLSHLLRSCGATVVKDLATAAVLVCGASAFKARQSGAEAAPQIVVRERWVFDGLQAGEFDLSKTAKAIKAPKAAKSTSEAKTPKAAKPKATTTPKETPKSKASAAKKAAKKATKTPRSGAKTSAAAAAPQEAAAAGAAAAAAAIVTSTPTKGTKQAAIAKVSSKCKAPATGKNKNSRKRAILSIDDVMADTPPKRARNATPPRKTRKATPPRSARSTRSARSARIAPYEDGSSSSDEEASHDPDADFGSPDI